MVLPAKPLRNFQNPSSNQPQLGCFLLPAKFTFLWSNGKPISWLHRGCILVDLKEGSLYTRRKSRKKDKPKTIRNNTPSTSPNGSHLASTVGIQLLSFGLFYIVWFPWPPTKPGKWIHRESGAALPLQGFHQGNPAIYCRGHPLIMVVVSKHFSFCLLWFTGGSPNPLNC